MALFSDLPHRLDSYPSIGPLTRLRGYTCRDSALSNILRDLGLFDPSTDDPPEDPPSPEPDKSDSEPDMDEDLICSRANIADGRAGLDI